MNTYEVLGRQTEAFELEKAAHLRTISVLKSIAEGALLPSQLVVTENTWRIAAIEVAPVAEVSNEPTPIFGLSEEPVG